MSKGDQFFQIHGSPFDMYNFWLWFEQDSDNANTDIDEIYNAQYILFFKMYLPIVLNAHPCLSFPVFFCIHHSGMPHESLCVSVHWAEALRRRSVRALRALSPWQLCCVSNGPSQRSCDNAASSEWVHTAARNDSFPQTKGLSWSEAAAMNTVLLQKKTQKKECGLCVLLIE